MAPTTKDIPISGPVPAAVLDKYKAASTVVAICLKAIIDKAVVGANVLELSIEGDRLLEEGTGGLYNKIKGIPKGIAFPTTLSINSVLQNLCPLGSDENSATNVLVANDLVKIVMGAHIDGYAVISAETIVVGATSPITDIRASLLAAAYQAGEVAIRLVKPGVSNWEVTAGIQKVLKEYEAVGVKGVEGILSHQFEQNSIEAKKGIVAFPTIEQRRDGDNSYTFDEGEVYGLNILVTNGEKGFKADASRTTVYQKTTSTYLLKMKTSRAVFSEVSKKAGAFPFSLRILEDESKGRFGIKECVQHGLLKGYEVATTDRPSDLSAQVYLTFAVAKTDAVRLSPAASYFTPERVQSEVVIQDEEVKTILARSLKAKKEKKDTKIVEA